MPTKTKPHYFEKISEEAVVRVSDRYRSESHPQVDIFALLHPNARARMATTLIEKWGMMAFRDDGEDSAGRMKIATLTPEEVVDRACNTADLALLEFEKRGWLSKLPGPDDVEQMLKEPDSAEQ